MRRLTAAHRNLPFETWVEVLNLSNGKIVDVRINDRGPFVRGRIIDLSQAAARQIDMLGPGTANVRLKVIPPPPSENRPAPASIPAVVPQPLYVVQAGAFADRDRAESLSTEMAQAFAESRVRSTNDDRDLWRVLVGREMTMDQAAALAEQVRARVGSGTVVPEPGD